VSLVFGRDDEVASWAGQQLKRSPLGGLSRGFVKPFTTIGICNAGHYTGAYVFNDFNWPDIEITVVGRGAITRDAFKAAAHYVFVQLGCIRVSARVRSDNIRLIKMMERIGFVREGCVRRHFIDADGILMGMLKEEYHGWC
jgi:RimJ/RimL family protein N-acetyltransferase